MNLKNKKDIIFLVLAGFFITNAIVAEMISSKLGVFGPFTAIVGLIPWPVVFLTTDIINEYYGKGVVKKLSNITVMMIAYSFVILFISMQIKTSPGSPATEEQFNAVFGQSMWVIFGSITAFFISQFVDIYVFWFLRNKTGSKMIWLRTTGSTVISQLVDSFVVLGIGFLLPGRITMTQFWEWGFTGYFFKLIIAVGLTPVIYILHAVLDKYLGEKVSHDMIQHTAKESLEHKTDA